MGKVKKITKGDLNKLIDILIYPYFEEHPTFAIIIDGLLHAMVEQDPDMSFRKFIKYNVPKLLRKTHKKNRYFEQYRPKTQKNKKPANDTGT